MIWAALSAQPGTAVRFTRPTAADGSAEVTIVTPLGDRVAAYVNPYDGTVLGSLADRGTVMWTVRHLHSLRYFAGGPRRRRDRRWLVDSARGDGDLPLVAAWAGRRRRHRARSPARRVFWRDMHAVLGVVLGGFIAFLAITGMPWSGVWGAQVNAWANGNNFGYPSGVRVDVPMSQVKLSDGGRRPGLSSRPACPGPRRRPQLARRCRSASTMPSPNSTGLACMPAMRSAFRPAPPASIPARSTPTISRSSASCIWTSMAANRFWTCPTRITGRWGAGWSSASMSTWASSSALRTGCCCWRSVSATSSLRCRPASCGGSAGRPAPWACRRCRERDAFAGILVILAIGGIVFPLVGAALLTMLAMDIVIVRLARAMHRRRTSPSAT